MSHDLFALFATGVTYLVLLFLIAYATDVGVIPERWSRHPIVYVLSLGVYATSWSFYGSVGFAEEQGYLFLTIYLGATVAFFLSPLLLKPLLRLTREYQLISLADLFAFRYRSQFAGALVTLFMLMGTLPYIALQIRAVTASLGVLTQETTPQVLALTFCGTLILFAILFGARHISPREKHRGLVVAIAFESLVKLLALLMVSGYAVYGVFSGPAALGQWLTEHPEATQALYQPAREGPWFTLLFLAFAASFLLPRQFHMAFTENMESRSLDVASWAFPLFLLLLNLAIPPILWAGQYLDLDIDPDYFVLGITLHQTEGWLSILAFVGGISAASAMVIVTTLALSAMCLNHLLLPASYPDPRVDLYRWLLWGRRILIAMIILAGYGFYALLEHNQRLVQLGLISFVAVAQFLPGIVGVIYWHRASRLGFICGLAGGILVWGMTLLLPLLQSSGFLDMGLWLPIMPELAGLDRWEFATFWSLSVNAVLFVLVSLLSQQSEGEKEAAAACCSETFSPLAGVVTAQTTGEFTEGLAGVVGPETADKEVRQALEDLGMSAEETQPAALRRLREQIERNLSGLIGPQMAHMIINQRLQLDAEAKTALVDSMRYVEDKLADSRTRLRGLSADLDNLRRYHRQILLDLPLGVCAVGQDRSIVMWNLALESMSGVSNRAAMGRQLASLPAPWGSLLKGFSQATDNHIHHMEVTIENRPHWYNLHKATIMDPVLSPYQPDHTGQVILLEDLTNLETLEAELAHTDRLASIGRLAAGVAHEIGNPVTGIASLAQNLREEPDPQVVRESIEEILHQTQRITAIVQSLMGFSHSGHIGVRFEQFPLHQVLSEAVNLVRLTRKGKQVEITTDCPEDLAITGDRQRLSQVLVNLCTNACDASQPGDRVAIMAFAQGKELQIEVLDQGEGIPAHLQSYVFDPFFTTKQPGEGTGLGLAMVYKIVEEHQGSIEIDSEPGTGTRMVVRLPQDSKIPLKRASSTP